MQNLQSNNTIVGHIVLLITSVSSSHVNIRYMSSPEKKAKICKLKKRAQLAENEIRQLKVKVKELTQKQGDCALHSDLFNIMQESSEEIKKMYPEGSFQRLFWEEQLRAARLKDSRQMRWHALLIRWCLNLKNLFQVLHIMPLEVQDSSSSRQRELYVITPTTLRAELDFRLK